MEGYRLLLKKPRQAKGHITQMYNTMIELFWRMKWFSDKCVNTSRIMGQSVGPDQMLL